MTVVSIHAPVRVRHFTFRYERCQPVSIHAPVRVRPYVEGYPFRFPGFNSRTREGATKKKYQKQYSRCVSIHAPVRVRQKFIRHSRRSHEVSIHAPVRVRPIGNRRLERRTSFNSRTREGATLELRSSHFWICFNSRTREGATRTWQPNQGIFQFQFTHP